MDAAKKAADLKAKAEVKTAEAAALRARAIAAGARAPSPSPAPRAPELTQRRGGGGGGGGAPTDSDESKVHGAGASGEGGSSQGVRLLLPVAGLLVTLGLRSAFPAEMDYVGFYMMLAIQVVLFLATMLFGGHGWLDWALVTGLGTLAALTRFWRIHDPQGIIFDEVRADVAVGR